MKIIVGLGNIGEEYKTTRHNAGFLLVGALAEGSVFRSSLDLFSETLSISDNKVLLAKPTTMMNASGKAVSALCRYFKVSPSQLYVAHDDLDIRLGEYKIQLGKGPKVHNGVNSIEEAIGNPDFWRIRIGVDNRQPESRTPGETYVLRDFSSQELVVLDSVIQKIADEMLDTV